MRERERERERGVSVFHTYDNIISVENLFISWQEFLKGKKKRKDVILFSMKLMDNIHSLHNDLKNKTYRHGEYTEFKISDPKSRTIHKTLVRDRLLHHAIYRILYPFFDKKFIYDSYSCRIDKGTHKAMYRFENFVRKVSKNNTKQCWILKCDIKKFFANIDHDILKDILTKYIQGKEVLRLLEKVINSFNTPINKPDTLKPIYAMTDIEKGLPLGNLTSQLLVNIYMNEFDQFVKHKLKIKYYIRYADDFVVLSQDKKYLENVLVGMKDFLENNLKLNLHSDKVFIKTIASGVDFLGWIHFPKHRILRTVTKKRMFRKIKENRESLNKNLISKDSFNQSLQSYLGMLRYCKGYKIRLKLDEYIKH